VGRRIWKLKLRSLLHVVGGVWLDEWYRTTALESGGTYVRTSSTVQYDTCSSWLWGERRVEWCGGGARGAVVDFDGSRGGFMAALHAPARIMRRRRPYRAFNGTNAQRCMGQAMHARAHPAAMHACMRHTWRPLISGGRTRWIRIQMDGWIGRERGHV